MQFESLAEFFAMGGHALYVWLAYGATLCVLIGSYASVRAARRSLVETLRWAERSAAGETEEEQRKL